MTEENKKTFLEELQSLDEPIKTRALVIGSGVLMVVVVFVWFGYFNNVVIGGQEAAQAGNDGSADTATVAQTAPAPAAANSQTANAAATAGPSLWQNIENGFASVAHIFQTPRQYNIQPNK